MKISSALPLPFFAALLPTVCAIRVAKNSSANTSIVTFAAKQAPPTFQDYYAAHTGRGVWKWSVALDMYQTHLAPFANRPAKLVEIGVQSGGSINMYQAVLPQCHYYGVDINTNTVQFNDARTTITIGDQASVPAWQHFFTAVTPNADIVIDDGGHQAHQMLATIQQVLPHMNPGGFYLTEDIHGQDDDYLTKYLHPAAYTIAAPASQTGATVESVHLYPFVLGVQMAGGTPAALPAATVTVATIPELLGALPNHPGGVVSLSNPAWGSFFGVDALKNFFSSFYDMYGGAVREEPAHCHTGDQSSNNCAMIVTNTVQQNMVKGVHILANSVIVELQATPPYIDAKRKGEVWIPYAGPAAR